MATTQLLSLVISAVDQVSRVVDNINGKLGGLGNAAGQAGKQTSGMSGAIAAGFIQAQVAIAAVTQGIGFLQSKIGEASQVQLENLTAASTFAALTGQNFDQASTFIDGLNERLAKSAAALPGATADYTKLARTIQDNVIGAFKDLNGNLNMKGFEDTLASITESFGVLAAGSGVDVGNTALGLTKALGGASISELRQIQIFEQNPAVLNFLEERLNQLGAKTLKDLDVKTRVKLIEEAGTKFVTGEFKTRAAQSVDGLLQAFQSTLFDPQTGIFGLMRDLDPNTKGQQTVFATFNQTLKQLVGSGGLFDQMNKLFASLGLTADPMKMLNDGLMAFNDGLAWISHQLNHVQMLMDHGKDVGKDLMVNVLNFLNNGIGAIANFFQSLSPSASADIGAKAGIIAGDLIAKILQFIGSLDWGSILVTIGNIAIQLISGIGAFAIALQATLIDKLSTSLRDFGDSLIQALLEMLVQIKDIAVANIRAIAPQAVTAVGGVAQNVFGATPLGAAFNFGKSLVGASYQGYIPNAASGFLGALSSEMRGMPTGASPIVANTSEAILTPRMLTNLVKGSVAMGSSGGTFAPQVVVNAGGGNPEEIAQEVLRQIEILYRQYTQGALA